MTTKNSFNAAPVEPIGDADNALNVTTVETAAECAEVDEQMNVEAAMAADFSEEDAALDAEKAGLAIGEETAEELSAADVDKNDLSGKSKQELVEMFESLLSSEPVQTLR